MQKYKWRSFNEETWRSFTFNKETYKAAADKQAILYMANPNKGNYWLAGRITFRNADFGAKNCQWNKRAIARHKKIYKDWARRLRDKGINLGWVRELTAIKKEDDISLLPHYHFIVLRHDKYTTIKKMREAILSSIPKRIRDKCDHSLEEIEHEVSLSRYIFKAATKGETDGEYSDDKWRNKRQLWPKIGLAKHGYIGSFWGEKKGVLWAEQVGLYLNNKNRT